MNFRLLILSICIFSIFILDQIALATAEELKILRRANAGDPESLDPHKILSAFESTIMTDMFIALATTSAFDKIIPGSAESWTITEDGLTYSFKIRDGIKWSDGKPLTSYDFVYSFQRQLDPKTASRTAEYFKPIKNAKAISRNELPVSNLGVYAPDPSTFIIELEHPAPYLMDILSIDARPVPKHVIDIHGKDWTKPNNMVVNGAFKLAEWRPGDFVKLVKNQRFYDKDNVNLDVVYHVPSEDMNTGFRRFRAGDLDALVFFPPDQLELIQKTMPQTMRITPGLTTELYIFNTENPPFDNVHVRRALSMAIDRELLVKKVLKTGETPAYSYIPATVRNYPNRPKVNFATMSMNDRRAKAKALLKSLGYSRENPLIVPLRYNTTGVQARQAAAIAAMWKIINVKTELINTERKVLAADRMNGNFSVARYLAVAGNYDPASFILFMHSKLSSRNMMNYSNKDFDTLFTKAWVSNSPDERAKAVFEAETMALHDHPMIPLYFYHGRRLVKENIRGWEDNSRGIYPSRWLSFAK